MSTIHSMKKTNMTDSSRKMRRKFINIGIETEKVKDYYNYNSTRNIDSDLKFPNIDTFQKINDIKKRYNKSLYSNKNKIKNININSKKKIINYFSESDNDIPKITSKINKNEYFFPNSVKNNCNTINYQNYFDDIQNSNLILSSVKTPKINILTNNNISNINNIYNKKDFFHNYFSSLNNDDKKRYIITIKNLKNSESDISLNEEEKNSIMNLLEKKTFINVNNTKNNTTKKIKPKSEFKEFLKEVLNQYKNKNENKIKKKININSLLTNKKNINNIKENNLGIYEKNLRKINNDINKYKNKNKKKLILRNQFFNSKSNKKSFGMLTEEVKPKKKNIFNMYRFKKNKIIMKEVEEELLNVENAIKKSFDKFKKNIDDEPVVIS